MSDFPQFTTARLELTKITFNDTASIFHLFSDPDVVRYYDLEVFGDPIQAEKLINLFNRRFEQSLGIRWAIRLKGSKELIGTCGFNSWNEKMHNTVIGYDLKAEYWNNGIVTEALFKIIQEAFSGSLPCGWLNRIQADTIPGNIGSEKVLLKLGFKEEGLIREVGYWKGAYHDLKCFGLLKSEFVGK